MGMQNLLSNVMNGITMFPTIYLHFWKLQGVTCWRTFQKSSSALKRKKKYWSLKSFRYKSIYLLKSSKKFHSFDSFNSDNDSFAETCIQNAPRLLEKEKKIIIKTILLFSNWNPNQYINGEENLMMKYGEIDSNNHYMNEEQKYNSLLRFFSINNGSI